MPLGHSRVRRPTMYNSQHCMQCCDAPWQPARTHLAHDGPAGLEKLKVVLHACGAERQLLGIRTPIHDDAYITRQRAG